MRRLRVWLHVPLFSVVNAVRSMRVSREEELEGLDIPQLGMEAYPEGEDQLSLA